MLLHPPGVLMLARSTHHPVSHLPSLIIGSLFDCISTKPFGVDSPRFACHRLRWLILSSVKLTAPSTWLECFYEEVHVLGELVLSVQGTGWRHDPSGKKPSSSVGGVSLGLDSAFTVAGDV